MKMYLLITVITLLLFQISVSSSRRIDNFENFKKNIPTKIRSRIDQLLRTIYNRLTKDDDEEKKTITTIPIPTEKPTAKQKQKVDFQMLENKLDKLIETGATDNYFNSENGYSNKEVHPPLNEQDIQPDQNKSNAKSVTLKDLEAAIEKLLKEQIKEENEKKDAKNQVNRKKEKILTKKKKEVNDKNIKEKTNEKKTIKSRNKETLNVKKQSITFEDIEKELERLLQLESHKEAREEGDTHTKEEHTILHQPSKTENEFKTKTVELDVLEKTLEKLTEEIKEKQKSPK